MKPDEFMLSDAQRKAIREFACQLTGLQPRQTTLKMAKYRHKTGNVPTFNLQQLVDGENTDCFEVAEISSLESWDCAYYDSIPLDSDSALLDIVVYRRAAKEKAVSIQAYFNRTRKGVRLSMIGCDEKEVLDRVWV